MLRPIVIGPDSIPIVTDTGRAQRNLELAVLSAIAHAKRPESEAIGTAVWHALDQSGGEDGDWYWDILLHSMDEDARRKLLMRLSNYRPQSDWGKRIYAQGQQRGEAIGQQRGQAIGECAALRDSVLLALAARGVEFDEQYAQRLHACADPTQLRNWLRAALSATTAAELFEH